MPRGSCEKCNTSYENKGLFIAGYCKSCAAQEIRAKDAIVYAALLDFAAIISGEHGRLGGTEQESGAIKLAREARNRIEKALKG